MKTHFHSLKKALPFAFLFASAPAQSQVDESSLYISGYTEIYFAQDAENPSDEQRPNFITNHKVQKQLGLNLAYIKALYSNKRVRANIALMTGTYAQYNLASESSVLRNIHEANVGFDFSPNQEKFRNNDSDKAPPKIWLDAGIFPSHIGFERPEGHDCLSLTRSLLSENSPYYETGIRFSYQSANERMFLSALLLNGWQRIRQPNGSSYPAYGWQMLFSPVDNFKLNISGYVGNERRENEESKWRGFLNLYGDLKLKVKEGQEKFRIQAGLDFGMQETEPDEGKWNIWYSPVCLFRYRFAKKLSATFRIENYVDKGGIIINRSGFKSSGYSFNFDYMPSSNAMLRIELRKLETQETDISVPGLNLKSSHLFITCSAIVSFSSLNLSTKK
jgi:hypothetical protein